MQILVFFFLLTLSGCSVISVASMMSDDKDPYGPWYGFIYEATARGEETRVYHGEYSDLNLCMQTLGAKTLYNSFAYFCGYNCSGMSNVNASYTCEKVMGSSLDFLPKEKWKG